MLSCTCGELEDSEWLYSYIEKFKPLKTKRGRRCCSCKKIIKVGEDSIEFSRIRYYKDSVEYNIFGDDGEIIMSSWYMCCGCGEIFLNLEHVGFCLDISENMNDNLIEYQKHYAHPAWGSFKNA